MYFPYLKGRQFELLALRELVDNDRLHEKIIPIIEPFTPTGTLLNTIEAFIHKRKEIGIVFNPEVKDFFGVLEEKCKEGSVTAKKLAEILENEKIIKTYILNKESISLIEKEASKDKLMVIAKERESLINYLTLLDEGMEPRYTLILNDKTFKRHVDNPKVLLEDCFHKRSRNDDYIEKIDESFSDNHLYYESKGFEGFSDFSIVGDVFNVSGFAPFASVIHLMYFDQNRALRIHHFVSDSNDGIDNPAREFGEALVKLIEWIKENPVDETIGLKRFKDCFEYGKYPGLGVVKKLSIMHHIELVSIFFESEVDYCNISDTQEVQ